ncbi:MAG: hypothetical protein HQL95_10920 [Magnetococcales bacterium]|nr:hypothetical protein [Magnetococcales bacterium]
MWKLIKQEYEALSHVEQYMTNLIWSEEDYRSLLTKRINAHMKRLELSTYSDTSLIDFMFEERMPWGREQDGGDKFRSPVTILHTLSRHRPRWLVELCKKAANAAMATRSKKITFSNINSVLDEFSSRRLDDQIAEFSSQCPELKEIMAAFKEQNERYTTNILLSTIKNRILNHLTPSISGVIGSPTATEVAHFLFQTGFLTARKNRDDGYDHVSYADNPNLLASRTNLDQGYEWEIHPVFRQALALKNFSDRNRSGKTTNQFNQSSRTNRRR